MKKVPSVVQLPGGIKLSGIAFRVIERHEDGSPRLFELLPKGADTSGPDIWFLFADADAIREPAAK